MVVLLRALNTMKYYRHLSIDKAEKSPFLKY